MRNLFDEFQALVMLHLWVEKNRENATGNVLERALKCIRREDIIHKCIRTIEQVTDVTEKRAAKAQLVSLGRNYNYIVLYYILFLQPYKFA